MFEVVFLRDNTEKGKMFPSFTEAFLYFHDRIIKIVASGEMTWQELETACWMSMPRNLSGKLTDLILTWYEARDAAHWVDIMSAGKLVTSPPAIKPEVAFCLFLGAFYERSGYALSL